MDGEEKNCHLLTVSKKYNLGLESEEKLITAAKKRLTSVAETLKGTLPQVPGLNFKPRQYTQWTMLGNGRTPPVIPEIFTGLTANQIIYFTGILEQISKGNLNFSRTMPEDILKR